MRYISVLVQMTRYTLKGHGLTTIRRLLRSSEIIHGTPCPIPQVTAMPYIQLGAKTEVLIGKGGDDRTRPVRIYFCQCNALGADDRLTITRISRVIIDQQRAFHIVRVRSDITIAIDHSERLTRYGIHFSVGETG